MKAKLLFLALFVVFLVGCTVTTKETQNTGIDGNAVKGKIATACTDAEQGINFGKKGIATMTFEDGSTKDYEDYCIGKFSLLEYYCSGTELVEEGHRCQYTCYEGVCLE